MKADNQNTSTAAIKRKCRIDDDFDDLYDALKGMLNHVKIETDVFHQL